MALLVTAGLLAPVRAAAGPGTAPARVLGGVEQRGRRHRRAAGARHLNRAFLLDAAWRPRPSFAEAHGLSVHIGPAAPTATIWARSA